MDSPSTNKPSRRGRRPRQGSPSRPVRRCWQPGKIVDLFAGAGGWAHGLRMLGMSALGIETDPWACATSRAAGHKCLQTDVTTLDPSELSPVWGLIASPPCQAYSTAGKGLGRADKPFVITCAHELAAGHDSRSERLAQCADPRSLLSVEPLRFALSLRPRWVALEQVPAVLELWAVFAELLAAHGYHTAAGILSAERYGVPQTRKRAFLIASLDGPVALPAPTHRSYNPRRKDVPDGEAALLPWVSMADALGWRPSDGVGFPRLNSTPSNRASSDDTGVYRKRDRRPASSPARTLTSRTRSWTRQPCGQPPERGSLAETTGTGWTAERPAPTLVTTRRSRDGALVGRQLPPGEGVERGGWAWRNGNQANASVRATAEPAPTVHFGHIANKVEWVPGTHEARKRGSGPAKGAPVWAGERPATTVACDRRVHPPGHKENRGDPPGRYEQRRGANAVRVTVEQAAILQGFPPGYPWQGARTRQFAQVGNAVPPPLAHRVLEQATALASSKRRSNGARKERT
jgi:DNA (cytosine-5)-methyltransferase 1